MPTDETLNKSMKAAEALNSPKTPDLAPKRKPSQASDAATPGMAPKRGRATVIEDEFPEKQTVALRMGFLGAGQGGGRLAQSYWDLGYRRVGVYNTTDSDFKGLHDAIPKLSLDVGGAGKDMQMAESNLKGRKEEIWDLMTRSWGKDLEWALICVGLGGGTGSGSAIHLVELARQYLEDKGGLNRVGVVVSLPRASEGQQVARNAVLAFRRLLEIKASPIIVVDNSRINELYDPGMANLHPTANSVVAQLFHLFNRWASVHSDITTFDKSELSQLMAGGIVTMGAAAIPVEEIQSPADVSSRIRDELVGNVLASVDLTRGRKAACLFVATTEILEQLPSDYFDAGITTLDRIVGSAHGGKVETVIHSGVYKYDTTTDAVPTLHCYTMVSELSPPYQRLTELAKKGGVDVAKVNSMAQFLGVD